ncbi:DJ-1/PfpI family protein [Candidatus Woesearchaeota archaeon]|nr:DJ-1/PfpI family protein [Candidatus Woesearchaeota archaeon]
MKALIIIAQEGFQPHEYTETKRVLEEHSIFCSTASIKKGICVDKFKGKVEAELAVKDAKVQNYDVIVVIGGPGAPSLADHKEVLTLLRTAQRKHLPLAAICIAPMVLAKAEVLEGKSATIWNEDGQQSEVLHDFGAIFVDESVVVDEGLVTADGPAAATAFGEKIVEMLQ